MTEKLRDIVRYRAMVDSIDMDTIRKDINETLSKVCNDLAINNFDAENLKDRMLNSHLSVLNNLEDMSLDLNTFKEEINKQVKKIEEPYYEKSKEIYKNHELLSPMDKLSRLKNKDLLFHEDTTKELINAITIKISNQYACCQLAPGYGDITKHLVHGTPLYIVEQDREGSAVNTDFFNQIMTNRIAWYTMNDNDKEILSALPQSQIGCFVVIDYFNFKSEDIIEKYLKSIYKCLRPGGAVIFTFNNCDYPNAIDKVDEMYYCYTTGTQMKKICSSIGFEILRLTAMGYDELENGISWLEIKKPGELNTIRSAQGLASIEKL
tara:strand:+ start:10922 stop:11887 length:966 start_codon:yes stop_codon:yes gene_type:complete